MTEKEYKDIILQFANQFGYQYAKPMTTPGFGHYFVLYTEQMNRCKRGKFGSPKIVTIDKSSNKPYLLDRDDVTELNIAIKNALRSIWNIYTNFVLRMSKMLRDNFKLSFRNLEVASAASNLFQENNVVFSLFNEFVYNFAMGNEWALLSTFLHYRFWEVVRHQPLFIFSILDAICRFCLPNRYLVDPALYPTP